MWSVEMNPTLEKFLYISISPVSFELGINITWIEQRFVSNSRAILKKNWT